MTATYSLRSRWNAPHTEENAPTPITWSKANGPTQETIETIRYKLIRKIPDDDLKPNLLSLVVGPHWESELRNLEDFQADDKPDELPDKDEDPDCVANCNHTPTHHPHTTHTPTQIY